MHRQESHGPSKIVFSLQQTHIYMHTHRQVDTWVQLVDNKNTYRGLLHVEAAIMNEVEEEVSESGQLSIRVCNADLAGVAPGSMVMQGREGCPWEFFGGFSDCESLSLACFWILLFILQVYHNSREGGLYSIVFP